MASSEHHSTSFFSSICFKLFCYLMAANILASHCSVKPLLSLCSDCVGQSGEDHVTWHAGKSYPNFTLYLQVSDPFHFLLPEDDHFTWTHHHRTVVLDEMNPTLNFLLFSVFILPSPSTNVSIFQLSRHPLPEPHLGHKKDVVEKNF